MQVKRWTLPLLVCSFVQPSFPLCERLNALNPHSAFFPLTLTPHYTFLSLFKKLGLLLRSTNDRTEGVQRPCSSATKALIELNPKVSLSFVIWSGVGECFPLAGPRVGWEQKRLWRKQRPQVGGGEPKNIDQAKRTPGASFRLHLRWVRRDA